MKKNTLGRTGLQVSHLTFGCGAVGGLMTKGAPADQLRAIARALDLGVNLFDTAPLYGDGASETNLGRILHDIKPDIVLATKVNIPAHERGDISRSIMGSLERSLKRLGRDHVDLFQLHNSIAASGGERDLSADVVLGEVAPVFERLQREGKIRYCGITAIGDSDALARVVDARSFDTAQVVYNMLNPSAGAPVAHGFPGQDYARLLDRMRDAGMGAIAIRAVAGGALSGEETRHPLGNPVVAPIGSGRDYRTDVLRARKLAPVVAEAGGGDLVELAVRYVASHPAIATLQVGIATVEQFEHGAAAVLKGALSGAALARIAALQAGFIGDGL